jgi:ACT domain-containing protein
VRVNVDLRLKDVPGQLIRALEPVSRNGGNIVGVVHRHDLISAGRIGVNLTFDVPSEKILEKVQSEWSSAEMDLMRIENIFETFPLEYVIVGDVSAAEMKRITDGIQALGQVESIEVRYSISSSKDKAAHISGKVRDRDMIKRSNRFMKERAKRSGFVIIRGFSD